MPRSFLSHRSHAPTFSGSVVNPSNQSQDSGSGLIAEAVVAGLCDAGVDTVVFSPGSRSTPLVLAFARRENLKKKVVLDERSAAFYALGVASLHYRPVVLVCTSGTAPAHYLPAILEARFQRIPLVILSADRPAELRDCGAGQTIDQVSLFPPDLVWKMDLSVRPDERGLQRAYNASLAAIRHSGTGPVQINIPFHEPFLPHPAKMYIPPTTPKLPVACESVSSIDLTPLKKYRRGLIVVGAYPGPVSENWTEALWKLSDSLGWPVLCDVLNPGRWSVKSKQRLVSQYEIIMQSGRLDTADKELYPEAILQVGCLPTAKPLRQWLEAFVGEYWQMQPDANERDPTHRGSSWIQAELSTLRLPSEAASDFSYRDKWVALNADLEDHCRELLQESSPNFEGSLYSRALSHMPENGILFLSNSTPVRDAEKYALPQVLPGLDIRCNRGVNGIDGLVSTAAGLAASGRPTVALLGDLAFLHDCAGLRLLSNFKGSLTIIVIQNQGGRIFESLPIRDRRDVLEEYFLTPQSVHLQLLCQAHDVPVKQLPNDEIWTEDDLAFGQEGVRVFIVNTNPEEDRFRRKEIADHLLASLGNK